MENYEKHKDGVVIHGVPQLGQQLFGAEENSQIVNDYGQVFACKLCEDVITHQAFIRVKTTVFTTGIDVVLAKGVFIPKIKWR